ncbi:MAG: DUF4398 domain-containing protein [Pseudobdellovibrionaceae bacterium]
MKKWLALLFTVGFLSACVTVSQPLEEYTLARAAVEAAKAVEAARYSPGNWHQAEEAYRKGQLYYKEQNYPEARQEFVKARVAAEKAENSARLIRQKNGEVL